MNIDALLDIEKRTGVKNSDIDDFLAKVTSASDAINGMKNGTVRPEDVHVPGLETAEEKAAKEQARREREEARRLRAEAEAARKKAEERETWWQGARLMFGRDEEEPEGEPDDESQQQQDGQQENRMYDNDYSRWNSWTPSDPVSKEEAAAREAELERLRNEEFERNNPEFCQQFNEDAEKRREAKEAKETQSDKERRRGNNAFRRKDFPKALRHYQAALKLTPFQVPILTNLAQVHLRLDELDDVLEYCDRALFVDPDAVKAHSRRAAVFTRRGELEQAEAAAREAVRAAPDNAAALKQFEAARDAVENARIEGRIAAAAANTTSGGDAGPLAEAAARAQDDPNVTPTQAAAAAAMAAAAAVPAGEAEEVAELAMVRSLTQALKAGEDPADVLPALEQSLRTRQGRVCLRTGGGLAWLVRRVAGGEVGQAVELAPEEAPVLELDADGGGFDLSAAAPAPVPVARRAEGAPDPTPALTLRALAAAVDEEPRNQALALEQGAVAAALALRAAEPVAALEFLAACARGHEPTSRAVASHAPTVAACVAALPAFAAAELLHGFAARPAGARRLAAAQPGAVGALGALLDPAGPSAGPSAADRTLREMAAAALANLAAVPQARPAVAPVARHLLAVARRPRTETPGARAMALAALVNATLDCEPVRRAVFEAGGVLQALGLLSAAADDDDGLSEEARGRAAAVVARCAQVAGARDLLLQESVFARVVALLDDAQTPAAVRAHLVTALAKALASAGARAAQLLVDSGAMRVLVALLPGDDSVTAAELQAAAMLHGNVVRCLLPCVADADSAPAVALREMGGIPRIVRLLARSADGPARQNAAIALARLTRNEESKEVIKSLRGIEMLMSLGKSGSV